MPYYKIEALIESSRLEEDLGQYVEGVMALHFKTLDLSVYEVNH